jgi:hypothetical protein
VENSVCFRRPPVSIGMVFPHRSKSAVCSSMEYRRIDLILGLPIRSCAGLRAVSGKRGFAYRSIVVRRSGPCLKLSPTVRLVTVHGVSGVCLLAGSCPTRLLAVRRLLFPFAASNLSSSSPLSRKQVVGVGVRNSRTACFL